MKSRVVLLLFWVIVLAVVVSVVGFAEVSVGVEEGDWVEYVIEYTGSPPAEYPAWLRIEVVRVEATSVVVLATRELVDGTSSSRSVTLDLETGAQDLVLIPANLGEGDVFYHEDVGNVTVSGVEEGTYAGAKRTMLVASVTQILFRWDQSTGVLLEASFSSIDFTQHLMLDKTNLWESQESGLPIDPTVFYALIIVAVVIVAVVVFVVLRIRKKRR